VSQQAAFLYFKFPRVTNAGHVINHPTASSMCTTGLDWALVLLARTTCVAKSPLKDDSQAARLIERGASDLANKLLVNWRLLLSRVANGFSLPQQTIPTWKKDTGFLARQPCIIDFSCTLIIHKNTNYDV